jgi:hypothetical protein
MPLNSADGRGHRPEGRKSFCSGGRGCEAPTFRSGRAYHSRTVGSSDCDRAGHGSSTNSGAGARRSTRQKLPVNGNPPVGVMNRPHAKRS